MRCYAVREIRKSQPARDRYDLDVSRRGGKIFVYHPVLVVGYFMDSSRRRPSKGGFILTVVESLSSFFLVPVFWPLIEFHDHNLRRPRITFSIPTQSSGTFSATQVAVSADGTNYSGTVGVRILASVTPVNPEGSRSQYKPLREMPAGRHRSARSPPSKPAYRNKAIEELRKGFLSGRSKRWARLSASL